MCAICSSFCVPSRLSPRPKANWITLSREGLRVPFEKLVAVGALDGGALDHLLGHLLGARADFRDEKMEGRDLHFPGVCFEELF